MKVKGEMCKMQLEAQNYSRPREYLLLGCLHKAQQSWEYPERFKTQSGDLNKLDTLPCWLSPVSPLISALQPSPELSFKHSEFF